MIGADTSRTAGLGVGATPHSAPTLSGLVATDEAKTVGSIKTRKNTWSECGGERDTRCSHRPAILHLSVTDATRKSMASTGGQERVKHAFW